MRVGMKIPALAKRRLERAPIKSGLGPPFARPSAP